MSINGVLCHDGITKKMQPKLSFNENQDFNVWKEQVKEKFIELLGFHAIQENECPLELHIMEEEQKEDYKQIRFEFESEYFEIFLSLHTCLIFFAKRKRRDCSRRRKSFS